MKANTKESGKASDRLGRIPTNTTNANRRQRFRILDFVNPAGSRSYRVQGMDRQGKYHRENFADMKSAQCRQVELEMEWRARQPQDTSVRATKLSDTQLRIAEACFLKLNADEELMLATDYWLMHGRNKTTPDSPRLDNAVAQFKAWLDSKDCNLRAHSKSGLKTRINVFGNSTRNLPVGEITPDMIEDFCRKLDVTPTTQDNYRRAVSRFFSWCIERPRRWATLNPCSAIKIKRGEIPPPSILTVSECEKLLRAAEASKAGALVPYVAVCLFAGLRPFEAGRLDWSQVNVEGAEIRLEGAQTKTKRPRVIPISPTLAAWLKAYRGRPFFPSNWRRNFDAIKKAAGHGGRSGETDGLKAWPVDIMRHTAICHHFRQGGSYGRTAEEFGNSEAIIKRHYQGRVTSDETKRFYGLLPATQPAGKGAAHTKQELGGAR
jgi:integrase